MAGIRRRKKAGDPPPVPTLKRVIVVKLVPAPDVHDALVETLAAVNEAANRAAALAFHNGTYKAADVRFEAYEALREVTGLSAQVTQHCITKAVDAYTTLHANARHGNLGKPGSKRYRKAMGKPVSFRPGAAQAYDDRILSWRYDEPGTGTGDVSIWTVRGRIKGVRFVGEPGQVDLVRARRAGETDLMLIDGVFYLSVTVRLPVPDLLPLRDPLVEDGWVGVDLGEVNIAVTSTGHNHKGRRLNSHRRRMNRLRAELQAKGTKSAKRRLKAVRRKESRRASDVNHRISKLIVAEAAGTGRGIAVEDLTGIRGRAPHSSPRRATDPDRWGGITLHSWSFHELRAYITYKAAGAGVTVQPVNPAYTSQTCADCGHFERANRHKGRFACKSCGYVAPADYNAARVIAQRAAWARRAAVNRPEPPQTAATAA